MSFDTCTCIFDRFQNFYERTAKALINLRKSALFRSLSVCPLKLFSLSSAQIRKKSKKPFGRQTLKNAYKVKSHSYMSRGLGTKHKCRSRAK